MNALALDDLYRSHGDMVFRRARVLLRDDAEAEDTVQEVFASLVRRPTQFHGKSAPSTFLYAMTTHACLNRLRDRRNRARLVSLHVVPRSQSTSAALGESRAVLVDLLARVPQELAEVAVYAYVDEMSQDEIAVILGCSRRHVGNLLVRFRENALKLVSPKEDLGVLA